jgi:hypothetical protein
MTKEGVHSVNALAHYTGILNEVLAARELGDSQRLEAIARLDRELKDRQEAIRAQLQAQRFLP